MSFSVNTNNNAMAALRTLSETNRSMSDTQSRINSGLAVGGAKDNASTFAIAQGMRGDIAGLKAVKSTLQLGETTVNVALSAAEKISSKLTDLKNKITEGQASNRDSAAIQRDVDSMIKQIDTMANAAQFNGVNLLNGVSTSPFEVVSSLNRVDASTVNVDRISIDRQNMTSNGLGVGGVNIQGGTATVTFDSTLDPQETETMTLTVYAKDKSGNATTQTHIFEFTDGATAPASVPVDDGTGANVTKVHAVQIDTATESQAQRLGKLMDSMREAGFSVILQNNGSMSVSSKSEDGTGQVGLSADVASDITGFTSGTLDTGTGNPGAAMTAIEDAINLAKEAVAKLGTSANQLTTQKEFVSNLNDLITSGVGSLVDADLAEESAKLQALQTKQQLGIQALSIANQGPGAVMSLFR